MKLRAGRIALSVVVAGFALAGHSLARPAPTTSPSAAFPTTGPVVATPTDTGELGLLEKRVEQASQRAINATVGLTIGNAQGSGIIVSPDGYILTAAHVSGTAGVDVDVIFADGHHLKAKTLGLNHTIDSGLIKLSEPGPYPYVEMGNSADLKLGQWVIAMGHPGGYRRGRPPVLRLGRVIVNDETVIRTDNTLVGGDSGGPLLDLDAKVVGINSRIGMNLTDNMHVPVDTFRDTWPRLVAGDEWGSAGFLGLLSEDAVLGVQVVDDASGTGVKVTSVIDIGPAFRSGIKADDVITKLGKDAITDTKTLTSVLKKHKPDEEVEVTIVREGATKNIMVILAKYPLTPPRGGRRNRRPPQTQPTPPGQNAPGQNQGQGRGGMTPRSTTRPSPSTQPTPP